MTELKVKFTKGFAKRATAVAMALCMGLSLVPSGLVANAATWEEKANGWQWKGELSVPTTSKEVEEGKSVELTASIVGSKAVTPVTPTATAITPTKATEVPEITWTPKDTKIATVKVSDRGTKATVTGVAKGTTTIEVAAGEDKKTVTITVKEVPGTTTPDKPGTTTPDKPGTTTPDKPGTTTPDKPGTTTPDKPKAVKVKTVAITLNGQTLSTKKTQNIKAGKSFTLKASVSPKNATNKKVTWSVDKKGKKIVSVSSKGKVTFKKGKTGTFKITAKAKDGSGKKATVTFKAVKKDVKVTKMSKISGKKTMKKGAKQTLKVTITPATATNQKITWKSSKPKVATVDKKGVVKAKKKGTTTITATSASNKKVKKTIKITVK